MGPAPSVDVTQLLKAWSNGDEHALARLILQGHRPTIELFMPDPGE